jgi:hypothetical protein
MLICNVSMHRTRARISADLVEVVAATDETATGNVVFATLVDDPASVLDHVDAYSGEIMFEAATAADGVDAGLKFDTAIDEGITAADASDGTVVAVPATTWNPSAVGTANVILSNGNLSYGAGPSNTSSDGCRSTKNQTTGKFYFEVTFNFSGPSAAKAGIATAAASYSGINTNGNGSLIIVASTGAIFFNGTNTGTTITAPATGAVICFAIDLVNSRGWIRNGAGNWNNSGTANPATNTGGINIATLFPTNAAYAVVASNFPSVSPMVTANFGATTFAQTVPSGFTAFG